LRINGFYLNLRKIKYEKTAKNFGPLDISYSFYGLSNESP
jgi:hypothetical protein